MYKACIFDLDGTLTDTLDSLVFSVNETLKQMELQAITRDQCRLFIGNGARTLMERALEAGGCRDCNRIDEAMEIYGRIFDQNCTYHVIPYEGVQLLLEELRDKGIRLAVLSNKPNQQTVYVVEQIFGTDLFDCVQGQMDGVPKKPDPGAALDIAAQLGAEPDEIVYIGDSEVDIATGIAAKMKTIGVSWGFRGRESLIQAGATLVVDHPAEIMELIWEKGGKNHE